jgi:hypothetical protein
MVRFKRVFDDWVRPSFTAGIMVAVAWSQLQTSWDRLQYRVSQLETSLGDMRRDGARITAHGSDGFLDPEMHGAIDQHLEHWHRQVLGSKGWRDFISKHAEGDAE